MEEREEEEKSGNNKKEKQKRKKAKAAEVGTVTGSPRPGWPERGGQGGQGGEQEAQHYSWVSLNLAGTKREGGQ